MRYLDKLEEARKELNNKDETQRAIDADRRYKAATKEHDSLPKGESEEKTLLMRRRQRALNVKRGRLNRAAEKMESYTSYQQLGDLLAEAMFGKIRSKIANKLDNFSRNQHKQGESDEAGGKERRATLRGRVGHVAGKLAQRVRPKEKSK